jgi:release factor glutamine methyltransferase
MYLCQVTIREFYLLFHSELQHVYDAGEVDAMWKWLIYDRLPEQKDVLRRDPSALIDGGMLSVLKSDLDRLKSGEPFQYVMGYTDFRGLRLSVDKRVLIPRPETEEMVDSIVAQSDFHPENIVDVCTGSGCIALALKKAYPSARVHALDKEQGALGLAARNSMSNGLNVEWRQKDILENDWHADLPDQTHLVVSNPPYVLATEANSMHSSVLEFEPSVALFVPEEDALLFYRPIVNYAKRSLVPGGQLWFEINPLEADEMHKLIRSAGFRSAEILNDLSGKARFARAVQ